MEAIKNFILIDRVHVNGVPIHVVRDDMFPYVCSGGKARKALYYEAFLKDNGYNAVVTCGGVQSNHNRAIAMMAAANGWKCHLCIQGDTDRFYHEKGNALLDRLTGAECELIAPEETSMAMDRAMEDFERQGYKPFYIHGGGHDIPGGVAFVDAVRLLKMECDRVGCKPNYIFHASGTGSTQAGILVGLDRVGWGDVKVIGISVARQRERGQKVIIDFADMLAESYGMKDRYNNRVSFCTDYLYGGYEQYTPEMLSFLEQVMKKTGVLFDTTYSGKAFYGMMDIVKKQKLEDQNIFFWHTGGIMNIMK